MAGKAVRVQIDAEHSAKLIKGDAVAFKVPAGTEVVQVRLADASRNPLDGFAKCMDVFFNGRKA